MSYKHTSLLSWEHTLLILSEQGSWVFFAIRRHIFGNFKINIWLGGKCRKVFILFIIQSRTLQR